MLRPPGPRMVWLQTAPTPSPDWWVTSTTPARHRPLFEPSARKSKTSSAGRSTVTVASAPVMVAPRLCSSCARHLEAGDEDGVSFGRGLADGNHRLVLGRLVPTACRFHRLELEDDG